MSAQPVSTVPAGSAGSAPPAVRPASQQARDGFLRGFARAIASDVPATVPLPSSGLSIAALAAYAIVTLTSGGVAAVGLASLPLVAASTLPRRQALWCVLATIALTLFPLAIRPAGQAATVATLAELGILLIAATAVRVSVIRLVLARWELYGQAQTSAAQMAVIQAA